jgi:hypothetical protein
MAAEKALSEKIAEFVGNSVGDLINKKQDLERQLRDINSQLAAIGGQFSKQLSKFLPSAGTRRRGRRSGAGNAPAKAGARSARASGAARTVNKARTVSAQTRAKMAAAARKRWAKIKKASE